MGGQRVGQLGGRKVGEKVELELELTDGRTFGRWEKMTGGRADGWVVSWMVGQSGSRVVGWSGELGVSAECWTVGRSDSWKESDTGAAIFGQSDGREVGEQVNLGQGQLIGRSER